MNEKENTIPAFDRLIGALEGLPDVTVSRPSTIRTTLPLIGMQQTWVVTTYRQRDKGDTIFFEMVSADGSLRLAIPPKVAEAIGRQREALTGKVRSKIGKASAAERKARGEQPGFMKRKA